MGKGLLFVRTPAANFCLILGRCSATSKELEEVTQIQILGMANTASRLGGFCNVLISKPRRKYLLGTHRNSLETTFLEALTQTSFGIVKEQS